jgi:hypothetical protein
MHCRTAIENVRLHLGGCGVVVRDVEGPLRGGRFGLEGWMRDDGVAGVFRFTDVSVTVGSMYTRSWFAGNEHGETRV